MFAENSGHWALTVSGHGSAVVLGALNCTAPSEGMSVAGGQCRDDGAILGDRLSIVCSGIIVLV